MPEEEPVERAREDEREGKSPSTQAGEFVREEMEHIREGEHGARSPQQAIAIGLSKARRAGVELPPPKRGKKRTKSQAKRDLAKSRKAAAKGLHARVPAPPKLRSNARTVGRHRKRRYHDKRNGLQLGVQRIHVRRPRRKPPVHANVVAEMDAAVCGAGGFYA